MDAVDVLEALDGGGVVSGGEIADKHGVSRNAVWKHVETLRGEGFDVESTDDGYKLNELADYGPTVVRHRLRKKGVEYIGNEIEYHESVGSTNEAAVEKARDGVSEGYVVLAGKQTAGRGRRERDWESPEGGVYTSVVLRPSFGPRDASLVTLATSVAVSRAVEAQDVEATIKWPNDVLVDGRKVCGILVEMQADAERIEHAVVGVGLNANAKPDVPDAEPVSLAEVGGEEVDRGEVTADLLSELESLYENTDEVLDEWRERSSTLGKRVRVETPNETIEGVAEGIDDTGALRVSTDGGDRVVSAGDCVHLR